MAIVVATFVSVHGHDRRAVLGVRGAARGARRRRRCEAGCVRERRRAQDVAALLKEPERLSQRGRPAARCSRDTARSFGPLQRRIAQSGLKRDRRDGPALRRLSRRAGLSAGSPLVQRACRGIVVAAAGAWRAVSRIVRHGRNARMRKFEEQFPEAIELIARALRAGHAFTTGLSMVAEESPRSGRHRIQAALRPAELRHAAARGAEGVRESDAAPRRPLLRHRRADAA